MNRTSATLEKPAEKAQAIQVRPNGSEPSIAGLLQGVIEKGVTSENVTVLEQLCGLYERMEDKKAEKEFNAAFAQLQAELPKVIATSVVPDKQGNAKYTYAPFQEIMDKVQPVLTKHGFGVSFNTRVADGRLTSICTLRHISGHSEDNEFAVRIGGGPPGATETQADGAAKTYAKRGALSDCLNIVVDKDDDARSGGGKTIGKALAEDLEARVKKCGADEKAFLKFAGAATYEEIRDDRFDALDRLLARKEYGKSEKKDKDGNYVF